MHPPNRRAPVSRAFDRVVSRRRTAGLIGLALLLVLAIIVAAGCGGTEDRSAAEIPDRKLKVATTTNFITDTVRQVGSERVEVTGLMGAGVDPHLYKASAGDVTTLRSPTR
jgi:manganese/zinc/iron transport system substrate-binding protein